MEEFNFSIAGGSGDAEKNGGNVFLYLHWNELANGQPRKGRERANISEASPPL